MRLLPSRYRAFLRSRTTRWVARAVARRWLPLATVLATMLVTVGINLLKPWPMKVLVDNVLLDRPLPPVVAHVLEFVAGSAAKPALLAAAVGGTVLLFLAGWFVGFAHSYAKIGFSEGLVYEMAARLLGHLQRLSLRFHARTPVGDTIRRVMQDCRFVATIVQGAILPSLTALFTLAGMVVIMGRMNASLTIVAVAVVPIMMMAFLLSSRAMLERSYAQQAAEGKIYNVVEESLSSIPMIQAFTHEERTEARLRASTDDALKASVAAAGVDLRFKILIGLAGAAGTAAVLWFGAHQVLQGQLTIGGLLVFLAYLAGFYEPLNTIMYSSSTVQTAAGSAKRVIEVLETEEEVEELPGAKELERARGQLRLEGVSFGYETDQPVLRKVNLTIEPGETVAIVGATGAGKSTLVSLVPRFFDPWEGRVLIDGTDVRELKLESLRRQIALVLQEPFLFPITVAENIAYGRPGAAADEIEAAARAANAHDFILRLPQGYETVLGERGATLSGGERQRISIARALLKDAPILILDEPTSALDVESEGRIVDALERLMEGRTTLIIAHRFSTIRKADRIVVLEYGRVVEQGTHDELLGNHDSAFTRLYRFRLEPALAVGSTGKTS